MIRIDGLRKELTENDSEFIARVKKKCGYPTEECYIYKQATDARRKNDIHFICSVVVSSEYESAIQKNVKNSVQFKEAVFEYPAAKNIPEHKPVIIGSGPAGTFAALCLANAGAQPIIIERGPCVEKRSRVVSDFLSGGLLDTEGNIQFGEGGAGTFSDGKLNTGTHSEFIRKILYEYVRFGAPKKILTDAKPHIGTDILREIAVNIRKEVERLGGRYIFDTQVSDFKIKNGKLCGIYAKEWIDCEYAVLAIGHSARDTFELLDRKNVYMTQKPFSVGVRIEHSQEYINRLQYGSFAGHRALGAADYKMSDKCYTFCMCPGGYVVPAASEEKTIVTNGMSFSDRSGENANSALLVNVGEANFGSGLFDGVHFQQMLEKNAYTYTGSYAAPVQKLSDFLSGRKSTSFDDVKPTYMPGTEFSDINRILPFGICDALKIGVINMNKKLEGFNYAGAVLTAPETRSSSPIRIVRDAQTLESVNVQGLYPCGEGAGYAGGIMSAAADGLRCAERIIKNINLSL